MGYDQSGLEESYGEPGLEESYGEPASAESEILANESDDKPEDAEPDVTPPVPAYADEPEGKDHDKDFLFTNVNVYYGTNRLPEVERWKQYQRLRIRCILAGVATMLFSAAVFWRKIVGVLAVIALLLTLWWGRAMLIERQQIVRDEQDGNNRYSEKLHEVNGKTVLQRGICTISIPKAHERGSGKIERPKLYQLQEVAGEHFRLLKTKLIVDRDEFLGQIKQDVDKSSHKHALVFIHGYNVSFKNAALRTAQLKYDLEFDGPAAFFSWPSNGGLLSYTSDEISVRLSVNTMMEFVEDLMTDTGAESIHLIAHSMGNRAMTSMLAELERIDNSRGEPILNQVIMAAPDVDATEFRVNIAPKIKGIARSMTLYASEQDIALMGSEILRRNDYTRLGQGGDHRRQILDDIQTIDATGLGGESVFSLGHSYFVHPKVLKDLKYLVTSESTKVDREWLRKRTDDSQRDYWVFE